LRSCYVKHDTAEVHWQCLRIQQGGHWTYGRWQEQCTCLTAACRIKRLAAPQLRERSMKATKSKPKSPKAASSKDKKPMKSGVKAGGFTRR
jgi:hypothetical protein